MKVRDEVRDEVRNEDVTKFVQGRQNPAELKSADQIRNICRPGGRSRE